ncbi:MAG: radical SAM protein [Candidatus Omnitrophica bacterium]|nr:radical SAM protein [Candidatus Omnitrophota bacterium]
MIQKALKDKLKIYLCDLTHDTLVLVSDTIPINIGFIAAYAKKIYGEDIEVSLFKYPASVIEAIQNNPPDVIALSNYSWNSRLSEHVAGIAKQANPDVITSMGGTNFPHRSELQLGFMLQYPNTDVFVELEGEIAFSNLVGRILESRGNRKKVFEKPVDGCVFIVPESRNSSEPLLLKGMPPERLKSLDDIPSPYLSGLLDHFFDGRLTPFLETNRGCPFACTFCHTGNQYFNHINMFSFERIRDEIRYVGPYMKKHGIKNLHIADTNFGMYVRDKEICQELLTAQTQYGWPLQIMATTGKNKKEHVIEITQMLGNTFSVNMSVQSMDPQVLENIKRANIKLDHYVAVNKTLTERGRSTKGELIVGLPGETKETFTRGVQNILEAGVSMVCTYSLMLLHGTPFQEPEYRNEFQIKGKYRIVPLNFGEYGGKRIFDYEEVGIANKDMSFEDYLWIRGLAMMVEVLHNSRPFNEFFRYAASFDIKLFDFILRVYGAMDSAPGDVKKIFEGFITETKGELWNSAEEMLHFYEKDANYKALYHGEIGGNVIYKYKAMSLAFAADAWADYLMQICIQIAHEKLSREKWKETEEEINLLNQFVKMKLKGVLNHEGDLTPKSLECNVDIVGWMKSPEGTPLSRFMRDHTIRYDFLFTEDQLAVRRDQFLRYGIHANALSKIVTRVSNVESLFRKIISTESNFTDSKDASHDDFVRYTLSN